MYKLDVKDYVDIHATLNSQILEMAITERVPIREATKIIAKRYGAKDANGSVPWSLYLIFDTEEDAMLWKLKYV